MGMGIGGTVVKRLLDCWVVRKEREALFTIVTIRRIILLLLKVVNVRVILCDRDIPQPRVIGTPYRICPAKQNPRR